MLWGTAGIQATPAWVPVGNGHARLGEDTRRHWPEWREELDGQAGLRSLVLRFLAAAAALFHRLEFSAIFLPPA